MATCRIQSIKPPCAYNLEGVKRILLLDMDDFQGFKFENDDLYNNCLVVSVFYEGALIDLDTPNTARYTSNITGGIYTHTLETFISALTADTQRQLHLATKRKHLVFFQSNNGKYYTFGYDFGSRLTYANQTAEATGSLVTLTATSIYPLFEVEATAITNPVVFGAEFTPDFDNNAYCITNG